MWRLLEAMAGLTLQEHDARKHENIRSCEEVDSDASCTLRSPVVLLNARLTSNAADADVLAEEELSEDD